MVPQLLGVIHGDIAGKKRLANIECRTGFERIIVPTLNDKSLLVFECNWTKTYTKDSWHYRRMHQVAISEIGTFQEGPALTWRDTRKKPFAFSSVSLHLRALYKTFFSCFALDKNLIANINTLTEIAERAMAMSLPVRISRQPTQIELSHIKSIAVSCKRFDNAMSEAAETWTDGQSYIIAGVLHTMTLYLRTEWPLQYLGNFEDGKEDFVILAMLLISLPIQNNFW